MSFETARAGLIDAAAWIPMMLMMLPSRNPLPSAPAKDETSSRTLAKLLAADFQMPLPRTAGPWRPGAVPRRRGRSVMSRKTVQRFVAMGVLALVVALAGPARAEARELRGPVPVWQWLTALWEHGVSALWPSSPAGATEK